MSGEYQEVLATANTQLLESSGVAITSGSIVPVSNLYDKMAALGSGGGGYPDGQFIFEGTFNTAPVENSLLSIYVREYPANGTSARTDVPEATRPGKFLGSFTVNDRTGLQTLVLMLENLPPKGDYYIHNNGSGQAVAAGWKLSVVPRTFRTAP